MPPDDLLGEDPAFAAWPVELRQAWVELRLPSLHEMLLAQEKLAAEVRRQNLELRKFAAAPAPAPAPPGEERLAALLAQARELGQSVAKASASGLIGLVEAAERHAEALAGTVAATLAEPCGRTWFGWPRPWPASLAARWTAQADGARLLVDKARAALADAGLQGIRPVAGAAFDPEQHRCVQTEAGALGRVLRLVREGWRQGGAVLRPAEVVIGHDQKGNP